MKTLEAAKAHLRDNWKKGTHCPCCTQFVKLYKRKFNTVMVLSLINLSYLGAGFHHVSNIMEGISKTGTNDFSKLKYCVMIAEMSNNNKAKKTSGYWAITDKGLTFLDRSLATVPKYANIYNGQLMGFSEERTTIQGALGDGFDFHELMNN